MSSVCLESKATSPTTPCGESPLGSYHRGGAFKNRLPLVCYAGPVGQGLGKFRAAGHEPATQCRQQGDLFQSRWLDAYAATRNSCATTPPLPGHSVGYCLGRENRPQGGFLISGFRFIMRPTQPPRLVPAGVTRNLGGFFMPAGRRDGR